jgi:hypothetical protein
LSPATILPKNIFRIKYPILAMDDWLLLAQAAAAAAAAAELPEKTLSVDKLLIFAAF